MRALGLLLLCTSACSVSPDLSALPCPCGPGFRCVADRCVPDDGDDAGDVDAGPMIDAPGSDTRSDTAEDVGLDAPPVDGGALSFDIVEDEGTGTNIDRFGDELEIDSVPGTGVLESRVFDAGRVARWTRFEWLPSGPYGRSVDGLPEPAYANGTQSTMDLRLVMPFDAPLGPLSDGMIYTDLSESARRGRVVGDGASSIEGIFGQAFAATDTSWTSVAMTDNLFPATGDHTLAFWARSSQSCLDNVRVFVGSEGAGDDKSHVWVGCWNGGSRCQQGAVGGVWKSDDAMPMTPFLCSGQDANDGEWHHIAVRKVGHDGGSDIEIWYDGDRISSTDADYTGTTFRFDGDEDLWFGHFFNGGYPTTVDLDEALFFARSLEDTEIEQLHLRGRLNAQFEIRVCSDPACSDGTYTSLEGGAGTSGDRPGFNALPIAYDTDFMGRYAQVRITMTSAHPSETPELGAMRLVAE